jgi:hypothetical protein
LGITALIFALLALIALYFYGRDHGWWNIASLPPANISAAAPPAATPPPASVNPAQGVPAPTPGNIQLQLSCADKPWQYSATEDTVTARCIDEKSSDNSVQPPAADEEESSPPPADPANVPVPEPKPEIQKVCGCGEVEKPRVYRQPDKPKKKVYRSVETACAWTDFQKIVGGFNRFLVVFHDDDRVADIPKVRHCLDELRVVTLVEADRRFIEDVQHALERRADLGCEADALRFASRQMARRYEYKIQRAKIFKKHLVGC